MRTELVSHKKNFIVAVQNIAVRMFSSDHLGILYIHFQKKKKKKRE
jgi:hypothetical protein